MKIGNKNYALSYAWKDRILELFKILVIVFSVWTCWLTANYVTSIEHRNIIIGFQIFIIFAVWMFGEYNRKRDDVVKDLERGLEELKKK